MPAKTTPKTKKKHAPTLTIAQLRTQLAKAIEAEHKQANAEFKKMSPAMRRVTLARDVLAQIAAKRLVPESNLYVRRADGRESFDEGEPMRDVIATTCEVCAKGALLVTAVERMNGATVGDIAGSGELESIGSEEITEYLKDVFDGQQLDLIEAAFENWDLVDKAGLSFEQAQALLPKYTMYSCLRYMHAVNETDEPTKRLKAIMQNIVKNKGLFVPEASKLSQD